MKRVPLPSVSLTVVLGIALFLVVGFQNCSGSPHGSISHTLASSAHSTVVTKMHLSFDPASHLGNLNANDLFPGKSAQDVFVFQAISDDNGGYVVALFQIPTNYEIFQLSDQFVTLSDNTTLQVYCETPDKAAHLTSLVSSSPESNAQRAYLVKDLAANTFAYFDPYGDSMMNLDFSTFLANFVILQPRTSSSIGGFLDDICNYEKTLILPSN
jgi:hypothetical protein